MNAHKTGMKVTTGGKGRFAAWPRTDPLLAPQQAESLSHLALPLLPPVSLLLNGKLRSEDWRRVTAWSGARPGCDGATLRRLLSLLF